MGLNPRASVLWHYLEKSLYVLEYSGTHGPSSLDWVFMEVNYTQMSTHTQRHTNATHPSVNIFFPKEMAHLSWDIPTDWLSLLKKAFGARAGLGFGLELMKGNTEYVSPALKEGLCAEGAVSAADLSCVLLDDCTAPLITMDNPLLWDWNGWWHQKDDCEE